MSRDTATLLEALPYIREFHGRTVVIKYGGSAMTDARLREDFAQDIVLLKYVGMNPVIVHGGGAEITEYMRRLDMNVEFVDGMRVSDADTVEVAKMVLVGKLNKDIVTRVNRHGQPAVGICGDDGELFRASKRLSAGGHDIGFVGQVVGVNVDLLNHVMTDYVCVIASVAADAEGASYNINADEAAGAVARALGAYKTIFLTDVLGWLRNPDDDATLISQAAAGEVATALDRGEISGGMLPKLNACVEAIGDGIGTAHIIDGRVPHSLLLELFTDDGVGTKIVP